MITKASSVMIGAEQYPKVGTTYFEGGTPQHPFSASGWSQFGSDPGGVTPISGGLSARVTSYTAGVAVQYNTTAGSGYPSRVSLRAAKSSVTGYYANYLLLYDASYRVYFLQLAAGRPAVFAHNGAAVAVHYLTAGAVAFPDEYKIDAIFAADGTMRMYVDGYVGGSITASYSVAIPQAVLPTRAYYPVLSCGNGAAQYQDYDYYRIEGTGYPNTI